MKASEFSVGNLVSYNCYIFKVTDISSAWPRVNDRYNNKPVVTLFDGGIFDVGLDEISPIPISEELLVKNGFIIYDKFIKIAGDKYYQLKLDKFTITMRDSSNTLGRDWWVHIDNEDCCTIASADVQYVHQMQNLFNIANVEMDIRL